MDIKEQARKRTQHHSERQKAREASREAIKRFKGENVHRVEAFSQTGEDGKKLRTCAYCRVSTDEVEQGKSIELQVSEYPKKIKANPDLEYAGLYVDDGFSGTNVEHRDAFQLMIQHAYEGRFDQIYTKSVSRFARNIIDCLGYTEELKKLGINVYFEGEGLNSMGATSSIILVVLAMAAQEESHSKSNAILVSIEWRFSRGIFMLPKLLGYDAVREKDVTKLVINQNESKIVKYMYLALLSGSTPKEIAKRLTETGCLTGGIRKDGTENDVFTGSGVVATMRNERYCGDVVGRKTYTPDYLTHKSKVNRGERNRYYQPGHHKGIVSRMEWNAAQRILNSRRYGYNGGCLPLMVIDRGILCGYVLVNLKWNGFELETLYRASSLAMAGAGKRENPYEAGEKSDGEGEPADELDLKNELIPDRGRKLPEGESREGGVVKIRRTETKEQHEDEINNGFDPTVYQRVSSDLFSSYGEPYVRITRNSIAFNSLCVQKLNAPSVQILFNPVNRMIAVRPAGNSADSSSASTSGNADDSSPSGTSGYTLEWKRGTRGASWFTKMIYSLMGWDTGSNYTIRAEPYQNLLLFDLEQSKEKRKKAESAAETKLESGGDITAKDGRIIYYEPDPAVTEDIEAIERRCRKQHEQKLRTFGKPASVKGKGSERSDDDWNAEPVEYSTLEAVEAGKAESLLEEIRTIWAYRRSEYSVN